MWHAGIIRDLLSAYCELLSFSVTGETEKIAGLWFAWWYQYPGWHYELGFEKLITITYQWNHQYEVSGNCLDLLLIQYSL